MKKLTMSAIALVLASLVFVLSGCEATVKLEEDESTTYEPDTAVTEITNEDGKVVATENVTMSAKQKEEGKNFYKTTKKPSKGVSKDRVQQALKDNGLKENGTPDNSDTLEDEMNQAEQVQDDAAILKSSQYLVTARLVMDGKSSQYKIARKNKKSSMTFQYNGQNLGFIITDKIVYMLSVDEKQYVEIPKTLVAENATEEEMEMLSSNPFDMERKVKKKTSETKDGIKYTVVIYESGAKDYFIGKTLIMTTAEDGSVMYYDSISPIAPSSLFSPPKGYTKSDVSFESTTASATECTDPNHDHAHDQK